MNKTQFMNIDTGEKTWLTPPEIIDALGPFDLDPCCPPTMPWRTATRMVCRPDDGLAVDWTGQRVWCNPPYGRQIWKWVEKGYKSRAEVVVMCLPARTDTRWFHDYCLKGEVIFLRGRIKFGEATQNAPFPSMIVVFKR